MTGGQLDRWGAYTFFGKPRDLRAGMAGTHAGNTGHACDLMGT
jgi:hypothetical protein